eukprot:TRINITY_DN10541_c0_g1_i1.p1 TRINITY_DN10541_c0_g1~~TRINITY_DN10541_c0_g1_i1.p1  ORF type:complete len:258 (-),score=54.65 TRINITY_DN10541_c0_g1_i1:141-842(-)
MVKLVNKKKLRKVQYGDEKINSHRNIEEPQEIAQTQEQMLLDKKAEKTSTQKAVKTVSLEERDKLVREAVAAILDGISNPDTQKSGTAYIPPDWSVKYKKTLGGYKKFVATQKEFCIVEGEKANFVVNRAGDSSAPFQVVGRTATKSAGDWKALLEKAWRTYCSATQKQDRSIDIFVSALPKGVREAAKESVEVPAAPKQAAGTKRKLSTEAGTADEGAGFVAKKRSKKMKKA